MRRLTSFNLSKLANSCATRCVLIGMRQPPHSLTLVLNLLPCCLFLAGCDYRDFDSSDRYQSDFHYTYALNPGGRLDVDNFNGAVEISGWDQPRCEITGSKYASTAEMRDRIKVEINQNGNTIYVHSARPSGEFHGNLGVRYVIHVPRRTELSRISSSNGSIHVDNTEGHAELKTSNGSVRVESLTGMLDAHTSNGALTVENVAGPLSLRTSNGAIRAEHVTAAIEATTSNGPITVQFDEKAPVSTAPLKFETNNGKIDITLPTPPRSEIRARTSNNSITLRLPSDASARIKAETSHGQVRSDFQSSDTQAEERHRRQSLEETIGSGGPLIDLHTSNGSIRLVKM
jgi:DUF4097 and DUF4098 domain-containing protein YvlB